MKRVLKFSLYFILAVVLAVLLYAYITFRPILSGMAAKTMCSCLFVMNRNPQSVVAEELSVFPGLSKATFVVEDSSVTASLLGKSAKAIYRNGLGCTLLADMTEDQVRHQKISPATIPNINPDTIPWPSGDLLPDSVLPGIDYDQVHRSLDGAFIDQNPEKPNNTHAVVVIYKGQLIGEKYAPGFNKDSRMMGWSMTKSLTNALVGLLVKEGRLKVDDPAPVEAWKSDDRRSITLTNLLQASSGLQWSEVYFMPGDFHDMFIHSDDKGGFASQKKLAHKPGTYFQYSSGTTNILSKIVRQTLGDERYYRFPYEELFYKIGMYHALIEPDASGTFVGSSYGFASARDWARFGLLFQQDGVWQGQRLLPEGWVKYSTTPAPAAGMRQYGAQWWLNAGSPENPKICKEPGLPNEAFFADGFEYQYVIIVPSKELVVVRLGVTHNAHFSPAPLVKGIIQALPK
jgi:CubicO group peptidase (beta-lactamase class C family)